MRQKLLLVCSIVLLGAMPISAQTSPLPKQFHDWKLTTCTPKPEHFAFGKEAGEKEFRACQFASGSNVVGISGGRYLDPSSAYEVYTSLLRPGMMPTDVGQASAFDKSGVIVQEGTLVFSSTANISKDDLIALVKAVEAKSEKSPLPPVRTYLPAAGRFLGSERYALGPQAMHAALAELGQSGLDALVDKAGFSNGAEAMLARYASQDKQGGVLLLLEYPTPQLAEQHIHHLDEVLPAAAKQQGLSVVRKGSLLSMVLSASSREYAKNLREAIDYETQVTWNEPSQTATDPPITSTLVKIIMGTFVFMIAAVVLGIAFGGVRVITKRLFPGKVFDRPEQIEILQLGLSGKRIDPSDFY
ncbi:MAG: DUF6599 family protein [Candidatus Acidiferrum sp.]